ncbi:MAG TPA: polyprenyl synthetase family protein [Gemmataceae bacterium]|nr:polyprenyl synthetase family protein [Gemmataceae bacterium]
MNPVTLVPPPQIAPGMDAYAPIAADLVEVERILARVLKNKHARVAEVVDHVQHYRGKRLRPMLLLLTARACGRMTPAHHVLGAVVEMIHTATLVHDDVLDGARVRRRVATVNAVWGVQTSVLLGDYLFTHAFHLASTLDDARACRMIGAATDRVCEGELCQVLQCGNLDLNEAEYFDIIDGKTAELTACCCHLGALYSGASPEVVQAMVRYGRCVGLAFQIADDLLDLVGEERTTGKSLGTDVEQQKLTLPLIYVLSQGDTALSTRVRQILSSTDNHKREALRLYLAESGALEYARRRAEELAAEARAELACLPPSTCRSILETLTARVVHRNA